MRHLIIGLAATSTLLAEPSNHTPEEIELPVQEETSSNWSVKASAGPAWRHLGSLRMQSGSRSQGFIQSSLVGETSLEIPLIGDENSYDDRTYNDGFVNQNALTSGTGLTWYWGHNEDSQVRNGSLFFTATGSRSEYSDGYSNTPRENTDEDIEGIGFHLDFTLTPPEDSSIPFKNILLSFTYFNDDQSSEYSTFSGSQTREDYRLDFVDRYDLDGVVPPLAPYSGTFTGPGPLIENIPDLRTRTDVLTNTTSASISNSIKAKVDMDVFSIALAPTLNGTFEESVFWQLSAGPTFNVFHLDGKHEEMLSASIDGGAASTLAEWNESDSTTKFRLGIMGRASVGTQFESGWTFDFFVQTEWVDEVEFSVGPSKYTLDPVGYSYGFGFGRRF